MPSARGGDEERGRLGRRRRRRASARSRILGGYVLLLVLAAAAALLLQRRIVLDGLRDDVDAALEQEVEELRVLADGRNPETGEPFADDVAAIFDTFLDRNIPAPGEVLVTYVGGRLHRATPAPPSLLADPVLADRWSPLSRPTRDETETAAGTIRWLGVPLLQGDDPLGVFVVAAVLDAELAEIDRTLRVGAAVWAAITLVATAAAWLLAGRVLAPIRLVTTTAKELSASDLTRRIDVDGDDEVAELARTFNGMLDRLEGAFASQRAFLDDAGHELRTPLTVVRGHLELLGDDPAERAEALAIVGDELQRMARIVDELLMLARAEQPDFLRLEAVDLDVLTAELRSKAEALGDRAWTVDAVGHGVLVADRQRLTQAMMNLLDNAVRHTEPGATVALGSDLSNGEARLWVRDTGPGIPSDEQERIFERFARADAPRSRAGAAGLGLAIVLAIATAHGGRVELASAPGAGATFTVVVPAGTEG